MGYSFSEGVAACRVADAVVFLDIHRNRYRVAVGCVAQVLTERARCPEPSFSPLLASLLDAGLLTFAANRIDHLPLTASSVPAESLLVDLEKRRVDPVLLVRLVQALLQAKRLRRQSALAALLPCAIHRDRRSTARPATDLALDYLACRPLVPIKTTCLEESIAMRAVLARAGIGCQLVFGVRYPPFRAHCWLQRDGVLLNETPDEVRAFTPILEVM